MGADVVALIEIETVGYISTERDLLYVESHGSLTRSALESSLN